MGKLEGQWAQLDRLWMQIRHPVQVHAVHHTMHLHDAIGTCGN